MSCGDDGGVLEGKDGWLKGEMNMRGALERVLKRDE